MNILKTVKGFFLPALNRRYVIRILAVALTAFLFFRFVAAPFYIRGASMAPTYPSRGFTFGCRNPWIFSQPERGDVVIIRLAGPEVTFLKRIVALPGEEVRFRDGKLYIDGSPLDEPYVVKTGHWDLEPRVVEEDHFYVVGDNRSGPIDGHEFGQVHRDRIIGKPIW